MLYYLQPAGAAASAARAQPSSAAAAAASGAAGALHGTPTALATPDARQRQVEAHLQAVYGHLLGGPKDVPVPSAGPTPPLVSSPEGLRLMSAAAAALRSKYVEFAHTAAHDLQQRASQLQAEAAKHGAAVGELAAAAEAAQARQAAIDARLARMAALHANLVERVGECLTSASAARPACGGSCVVFGKCLPFVCVCVWGGAGRWDGRLQMST